MELLVHEDYATSELLDEALGMHEINNTVNSNSHSYRRNSLCVEEAVVTHSPIIWKVPLLRYSRIVILEI